MSQKKPIRKKILNSPKATRARRASTKAAKITTKTTVEGKANAAQTKALIDIAAQKRAKAAQERELQDAVIGTINWQWRKFALGLMNGLHNYKAYAEAYDMNDVDRDERAYQLACALSSRLVRNDKFRAYWRELIVEQGFNDDVVDTEMVKLITDPTTPAAVRKGTIRDYNELTGRIVNKTAFTDGSGKSLFDSDNFTLKVVRNADGTNK